MIIIPVILGGNYPNIVCCIMEFDRISGDGETIIAAETCIMMMKEG